MMEEEGEHFDVLCIGAGFSGLTAAYTLLKAQPSLRVCVLEAKDRLGGRTCLQKLKCADADGNDDVCEWEFGGMWVGRNQLDVMELLQELNIETYEQFITGKKCVRLSADKNTKNYISTLPSVGVLSTVDLGQAIVRLESLIKSIDVSDPWGHPEATYLDSITVATLLNKYSWTARVKEIFLAAVRTIFGADMAQINALYFVAYCAANGSLQELTEATPGSAQEYKIKGGSQKVCMKLVEDHIGSQNVKLSAPVTRIQQTEELVTVDTATGSKYTAKHVIITSPPQETMKIEFTPSLPNNKRRLYQFMPVGHLMKVIVTYRKAYWRLMGYSGEVVTTDPMSDNIAGALSIVYDATSEHGHPALVAFIGGNQATVWGDKPAAQRRDIVLRSLSEHFGIPELTEPIDYGEKDWAKEAFNGGCPVTTVSLGVMQFYKELKSSVGRLEFAGTESSDLCCGYLSGAVGAGKRAANKVLGELSREGRS